MFLNGKEVSGKDLTTVFPKYNDTEYALKQSQNLSSDLDKGNIRCLEPFSKVGGNHRTVYEFKFDPSLISGGSAKYNEHYYEQWPGFSTIAKVQYNLQNEREAGIDVPEGLCINIWARSYIFELTKRNVSGNDVYTVEGEADYFCGGII